MDELEQQLEHVRRQWAELTPRPVQQPGPPLIVGGTAGPRSCRLGARYADEYNTVFAVGRGLRRAEGAGRRRVPRSWSRADPVLADDRLRRGPRPSGGGADRGRVVAERTGLELDDFLGSAGTITGTVDEVVARIGEYARVGVERVYLQHLDHRTSRWWS